MIRLTLVAIVFVLVFTASLTQAQTSSFTYQGRFTDGGTAANGPYEMQFRLFDALSAGNQIGSTITNSSVSVSNGVFTVQLDYGASAFSGADRYLEIGVRAVGDSNPHTILSPRQLLTSAVYAIRAGSAANADSAANANNASQLGGVAAGQYVQTGDSRLTDARTPIAGSGNYIQNTTNQQTANFNVSGNGTAGGTLSANIVNAAANFSIGGKSVLSADATYTSVGISAGKPELRFGNTFVGSESGKATAKDNNSFFGAASGKTNTEGADNSFFGHAAGQDNTNGNFNSFFGSAAGLSNTTGGRNAFFGANAGLNSLNGNRNVFIGESAGKGNVSGSDLTILGNGADLQQNNLQNATAVGANALVSQSNSLVLGSIKGLNDATADTNVGIGTTSPKSKFHIQDNNNSMHFGSFGCSLGFIGLTFGSKVTGCTNYTLVGNGLNTYFNRPPAGAFYFMESNNQLDMSITSSGTLLLPNLAVGGSTNLCYSPSKQIAECGSSLRYKTHIQPFFSGLSVLNRLRPITFDWKEGGLHDLGFGAEEVAAVEPLLVTHNDKGQAEGVKYDRITAVLVNAVKEQQEQIRQQQNQIASLKRLVCRRHASASACKR